VKNDLSGAQMGISDFKYRNSSQSFFSEVERLKGIMFNSLVRLNIFFAARNAA
jgi:hypothetical protein